MAIKRRRFAHLQKKGVVQKVMFARQEADKRAAAIVFVVDSDGKLEQRQEELAEGREGAKRKLPMAIGVAHPCIESWLLTDATAIRRGLELERSPAVPEEPENLPAPCRDRAHNPKTVLAKAGGSLDPELSAKDKDKIAKAINDLSLLRQRCPLGFAPFADEVEERIRPLF